jgi:methionyl-tRNA synthetase
VVPALNRTIHEKRPWELDKRGDVPALDAVLYELCEGLRWLAHLIAPFMPATARGIWAQLGFEGEPRGAWPDELVWGRLESGSVVAPSDEPLFPRL